VTEADAGAGAERGRPRGREADRPYRSNFKLHATGSRRGARTPRTYCGDPCWAPGGGSDRTRDGMLRTWCTGSRPTGPERAAGQRSPAEESPGRPVLLTTEPTAGRALWLSPTRTCARRSADGRPGPEGRPRTRPRRRSRWPCDRRDSISGRAAEGRARDSGTCWVTVSEVAYMLDSSGGGPR